MSASLHCREGAALGAAGAAPAAGVARQRIGVTRLAWAGGRWLARLLALAWLLTLVALPLLAGPARAGIPDDYAPLVVQPKALDGDRLEFDLRPAIAQARTQGKRLYVYLGANDCAYCRRYERFLAANVPALRGHFAKDWLVVDLRSQLSTTAAKLLLRTGTQALAYADFQRSIGDERARMLVYPSVWLLDATSLKPLMQMPAGNGTFETVDEQLEILRLEQ